MRNIIFLLISMLVLLLTGAAAQAQGFEHGNQPMQIFDQEGFNNSPRWVQLWVYFMLASFALGFFFLKNHAIARWLIGGIFAGMIFVMFAGKVLGIPSYSDFIALIHLVFWSPVLYQLLSKRPFLGERSAFSVWAGLVTFVICFSFIFDFRDAVIYLSNVL